MGNMSIKALSWAIKKNCNTPTTKLVLFILSNYADENDTCYPSEKHLGMLCGITDRQVRRCLKWLEENNFLNIERTEGKSNRYHLVIVSTDMGVQPLRTQTSNNTKDDSKNIIRSKEKEKDLESFEKFWKYYPRKVSKKKAREVFLKIDRSLHHLIIKRAGVFQWTSKDTELRFIPHASTWLNQERWEDVDMKKIKKPSLNNIAG
tara:strand:+ start:328 stop:942 length:615 start_codon:yes stop_codon:yes gene_type:complete